MTRKSCAVGMRKTDAQCNTAEELPYDGLIGFFSSDTFHSVLKCSVNIIKEINIPTFARDRPKFRAQCILSRFELP